jgi:nucleotide-binding universal stress UspA family protein
MLCPYFAPKEPTMIQDTKTILLASDFSQSSQRAFDAAVQLARTFDAKLHILHVNEEDSTFEGHNSEEITHFLNDIARRRSEWMDRFEAAARDVGVAAVSVLREGKPAETIIEEADGLDAGVIVIGTQGLHGLGNMLPGSVARKVLRGTKRAVMVVSRMAGVAPLSAQANFENVIYPTDFSEASKKGLSSCEAILDKTGANLTLVNILRMPRVIPVMPGEAMVAVPFKAVDHLTARLENQMSELQAHLGREKVNSEIGVHADPAQGISEMAAHGGVDLIIMPRHSSHGVGSYFFGSTAERLVKMAPVPVLLFTPEES